MQARNPVTTNLNLLLPATFLLVGLTATGAVTGEGDGFSMRIVDVFSITGQGIVMTGKIESGAAIVGEAACIPLSTGETAARRIEGIEQFRKVLERAESGENVGIMVGGIDKDEVIKGELMHGDCSLNPEASAESE